MPRAAGYVRVLPAERADAHALANEQRDRIQAYVRERGWELARMRQDEPGSDRPTAQLQALLADLADVEKLVVASADRLGGTRRLHDMIGFLDSKGVDLVCIEHDVDTGASNGGVMRSMLPMLSGWQPHRLRDKGLSPLTVIDVGVGAGTPELYEAFPDAYQVLIEPLAEFLPSLRRIVSEYDGEYHLAAVGESEGEADLIVDTSLALSSFLEAARDRPPSKVRKVPLTTLDGLFRQQAWAGPFGLKIDVEGYEHRVINGAKRVLRDTQFVIAETSVSKRYENSVRCDEFIALMLQHGFVVADVLSAGSAGPSHGYREGLGELADLLFVSLE